MTKLTLYHNPRCSKSRAALALLQDAGVEPELRLYLDEKPDIAELRKLQRMLDMPVRDLLRSGEDSYRELGLGRSELDDETLLAAIAREPRLLQRPIAVLDGEARLGRPPERVLELLP